LISSKQRKGHNALTRKGEARKEGDRLHAMELGFWRYMSSLLCDNGGGRNNLGIKILEINSTFYDSPLIPQAKT